MLIISKARLLPPSEADSLIPICEKIIAYANHNLPEIEESDELLRWFSGSAVVAARALDQSIRDHLVGGLTISDTEVHLSRISVLAATFYVALFSVMRRRARPFRSSNPTWMRDPRAGEAKIEISKAEIFMEFRESIKMMSVALFKNADIFHVERGSVKIEIKDNSNIADCVPFADLVLTSPPYCTRIDYTRATSIELALLFPLIRLKRADLSASMLGSVHAPASNIDVDSRWGATCIEFLNRVYTHKSKASSTYYYKTHLDYFMKLRRSIDGVVDCIKPGGGLIAIIQNSFYKEILNDLPKIFVEMCAESGFSLERQEIFPLNRGLAMIHPQAKVYARDQLPAESVLCLRCE
jgi:hypothetical protein